ncbi:MAG: Hint domain-containing protein [Rhodobacteraceae bacterium]|nr:Hint domain-containing protein [Paracoccaceae bacterium]
MRYSKDRSVYHSLALMPAEQFVAVSGANFGDGIGAQEELVLDDTYRLQPAVRMIDAGLVPGEGGALSLRRTQNGRLSQSAVAFETILTFLGPDATAIDCLVLAETETPDPQRWLLPFGTLRARSDYSLIAVDPGQAAQRFASLSCASFVRGSRITTATGEMVPVQHLRAGDMVLTRDNGVQALRWSGQITARAIGHTAPVRIAAGALNNAADLLVSPNHRLFIYQRADDMGSGRPEVTVCARDLINGDTVEQIQGGFVDYFQLLFDAHETIYAEGIACESMRPGPDIALAVPAAVREMVPGPRSARVRTRIRVDPAEDERAELAERLRRASLG